MMRFLPFILLLMASPAQAGEPRPFLGYMSLAGQFGYMASMLEAAQQEGKFGSSAALDFSGAKNGVYDPEGPVRAQEILPENIKVITTGSEKIIFNTRRKGAEGKTIEALFAVIPEANPAFCAEWSKGEYGMANVTLDKPLEVPPDNKTPVDDPAPVPETGCVKDSGGKLYYLHWLLQQEAKDK